MLPSFLSFSVKSTARALTTSVLPRIAWTPAERSRLAARAVRVAFLNNAPGDALLVVQSILEPGQGAKGDAPLLKFSVQVPARLPFHAFVHGLIRSDMRAEAVAQVCQRMQYGMKIHTKTLEELIRVVSFQKIPRPLDLSEETYKELSDGGLDRVQQRWSNLDMGTQLAILLLESARESRNQRTGWMYNRVIHSCLLQGQTYFACLLFVLLIRDWQVRRVLIGSKDSTQADPVSNTPYLVPLDSASLETASRFGLDDPSLPIPFPLPSILERILITMVFPGAKGSEEKYMHRPPDDDETADMLRGLHLLAASLRAQQIPFGQVHNLIRVMSTVPRHPYVEVVVTRPTGEREVLSVHKHAHEVLHRLIHTLPVRQPTPTIKNPALLKPLSLRSCNTLLHYALRHRLSLSSTQIILDHMVTRGLKPDIVTFNILLRSASLLRQDDIVEDLLQRLYNARHAKNRILQPIDPPSTLRRRAPSQPPPKYPHFSAILHELTTTPWTPPELDVEKLHADAYTISSYITYLTSTRRSAMVAQLLFQVFPELKSEGIGEGIRWRLTRKPLLRAAKLGPYFFSTILNALEKGGLTTLAEKVWLLGRLAEEESWTFSPSDEVKPWCLTVEAYTSIMKCYAKESKKGLHMLRSPINKPFVVGWGYYNWLHGTHDDGLAIDRWGHSIPRTRWIAGRELGFMLWKSMRSRARALWTNLQHAQDLASDQRQRAALAKIKFPIPDARFFNVCLDVFGRMPGMVRRRPRPPPAYWRCRNLRLEHEYAMRGHLVLNRDPSLVEVAEQMAELGFRLPEGLRQIIANQRIHVRSFMPPPPVRPFTFPKPTSQRVIPYSIPTFKTRGLPFAKRLRKWHVLLSRKSWWSITTDRSDSPA